MQLSWVKNRLYSQFKKHPFGKLLPDVFFKNAPLNYINVALLILLQISVWGTGIFSLWQESQKNRLNVQKAQSKLLLQEKLLEGDYFPEYLKKHNWLSWKWTHGACHENIDTTEGKQEADDHTLKMCLQLEGETSDDEWRTALIQLDEFAPFFPVSMSWKRLIPQKTWGRLYLQLIKRTANRAAYPLFPFAPYPSASVLDNVQLVGTVFANDQWRSLLVIDGHSLSVSQGDWLPIIMASVESIEQNEVKLSNLNGDITSVYLQPPVLEEEL
ncbi:hypothetical protein O1D97_06340 [Marinomonas sp. 15G1-11]|uniref:Uncharacterized protein n=1 Tax=Marinomonas phaeophyticola TaxID=3004091 RepID=A0ABT4JSG4_9GAMM|nr:hypothetical protein [Marinomonas sp. 15G1-11]MCZ2721273.1 hypothetical protein [Marinomonas sp. 15G1-11]